MPLPPACTAFHIRLPHTYILAGRTRISLRPKGYAAITSHACPFCMPPYTAPHAAHTHTAYVHTRRPHTHAPAYPCRMRAHTLTAYTYRIYTYAEEADTSAGEAHLIIIPHVHNAYAYAYAYACLIYTHAEAADAAIEGLNGKPLGDRSITVANSKRQG